MRKFLLGSLTALTMIAASQTSALAVLNSPSVAINASVTSSLPSCQSIALIAPNATYSSDAGAVVGAGSIKFGGCNATMNNAANTLMTQFWVHSAWVDARNNTRVLNDAVTGAQFPYRLYTRASNDTAAVKTDIGNCKTVAGVPVGTNCLSYNALTMARASMDNATVNIYALIDAAAAELAFTASNITAGTALAPTDTLTVHVAY